MADSDCVLGDQFIRDTTSFRWLYTTPTFLFSLTSPYPGPTRPTKSKVMQRNNNDTVIIQRVSANQTLNYTKEYNLIETKTGNKTN